MREYRTLAVRTTALAGLAVAALVPAGAAGGQSSGDSSAAIRRPSFAVTSTERFDATSIPA